MPHLLDSNSINLIEQQISYTFKDKRLLSLAFTHSSFAHEQQQETPQNERLEFLGDAVLGLIISEHLYTHFKKMPEGRLSQIKSQLINASACTHYMKKINIHSHILLGKGEKMALSKGKNSILADLFEALIGAIYLDGGLTSAKNFLFKYFFTDIEMIIQEPKENYKALLQDFCQQVHKVTPSYHLLQEEGPDHHKTFSVSVNMGDQVLGIGQGTSKKEAQQHAAKNALESINNEN